MTFERVAIIGTGLIGASLGLALRGLPTPPTVVGADRNRSRGQQALRDKAVDRMARSLEEAVSDAELVVLAVPVRAARTILKDMAPFLRPDTVVTDTGSTKREVLDWANEYLPPGVAFVGGHPMAGRLTSASREMQYVRFEQTVYCLTPTPSTAVEAVEAVARLVEAIGAVPYFLDPDEHDGLVAAVSHLPYVLASALVTASTSHPAWREMSMVAAGGFAAATRLVEADPQMYADICLTNRRHLARHIGRMIQELEQLRAEIERGDEGLLERFTRAQEQRAAWLDGRAGPEEPPPLRSEDFGIRSLFLPRGLRGERERPER